jgi:hypothetical protein
VPLSGGAFHLPKRAVYCFDFLEEGGTKQIRAIKTFIVKKNSIILLVLVVSSFCSAQVAINNYGGAPDGSAVLDVSSANKGVLIPRVYINAINPQLSIPNAAHALLVFNTNQNFSRGIGFYYNAGTAAAIDWRPVSDIVFPFYKGISNNGSMFQLENYSQSATSSSIKALSSAGTAVFAETLSGYALQTRGKINISGVGQTPAAGKVLTSDANGNATWEGAIAFSASGIQEGGAAELPAQVWKKVPFIHENYDLGNNFNPSTISPHSTFTVPVRGIYLFNTQVAINYHADDVQTAIRLVCERNGSKFTIVQFEQQKYLGDLGLALTKECDLLVGDKVWVEVIINTSGASWNLALTDIHNYFSGRLVLKL